MAPLGLRVFDSPLAFVSGCLVWIPVCLWIISLVHWMIQGDVDIIWGIIGLFTAFMLGIITMLPPRPQLAPFMLAGAVVTTMLFPVFRNSLNKRALDSVDIDAIEDAYEMLRIKPDNHVIRFKFAKLLYKRGMRGSALAFGQQALAHMPGSAFFEEHRLYELWKRSFRPGHAPETSIVCLECGTHNDLGTFTCRNCNSEFLIDHVRGRWVGRNLSRKLLSAWIAVMLAMIGVPLAAVMLDRAAAAGVIVMLLVAAVGMMIIGFHPRGLRS